MSRKKQKPALGTKQHHQMAVGLVFQGAQQVVRAADLASLGLALADTVSKCYRVAKDHGLNLNQILDAYAGDNEDKALKEIMQQCQSPSWAYVRFPYARASSGEVAKTVLRYAARHRNFDVDDLLRTKRLQTIYGNEREGRKKLVAILHQMYKEKVLNLIAAGEMGAKGRPATYALNYE